MGAQEEVLKYVVVLSNSHIEWACWWDALVHMPGHLEHHNERGRHSGNLAVEGAQRWDIDVATAVDQAEGDQDLESWILQVRVKVRVE